MTITSTSQWEFSSPQGKANYAAACRRYPGQIIVDLAALRDNMRRLVELTGGPDSGTAVMGVIKADAYGHGLIPTALAALAGGATWLGSAQTREALALRRAGIGPDRCRILVWMFNGGTAPLDELIEQDIDISAGSMAALEDIGRAAQACGRPARVHVEVDSGFGRNGFTEEGFGGLLARLSQLRDQGLVEPIGLWSHLAVADSPDTPAFVAATDQQIAAFARFSARMDSAGLHPQIRHLANTAATLTRPEIHFDLTRPGIGLYGYEADPAMGQPADYGLKPAMTLQAQLSMVKDIEEGHGISYGRTYLTPQATSTAIVPLGYADGIHRSASGFDRAGARHVDKPGGPVRVMTNAGPRICRVAGRVCMDQFVLDLQGKARDLGVAEGDTVVLFGPGRGAYQGEPTADDWARSADTISYEIFTCLRNRIPRLYLNAPAALPADDLAKLDPASIL
ncbi:alanine racemase [Bifidobacterium aemilianum]|uniref:Alanine racemase n=1 Tax=Bifidobacterium aemilianum TaxID=2493120 RepID=A0A366K924_9BIFI|nr:alanine racemase [Bifidobacterium aemilianum]RBP98240.1 alanine racemase [Bifidobacterium aemilianum]